MYLVTTAASLLFATPSCCYSHSLASHGKFWSIQISSIGWYSALHFSIASVCSLFASSMNISIIGRCTPMRCLAVAFASTTIPLMHLLSVQLRPLHVSVPMHLTSICLVCGDVVPFIYPLQAVHVYFDTIIDFSLLNFFHFHCYLSIFLFLNQQLLRYRLVFAQ